MDIIQTETMACRGDIFPTMFQMFSILYLLYLVTEIKVSENISSLSSREYAEFLVLSRYMLI